MALSPLVEKMLAQMVQQQGPMLSPLAPIGQMALTAALAERERRGNKADEAERAQQQARVQSLIDVMSRGPQTTSEISLESVMPGQGPTNYSVPVTPEMGQDRYRRDLLSAMAGVDPAGAASLAAAQAFKEPEKPKRNFATITGPDGKQVRIATDEDTLETRPVFKGGVKPPSTQISLSNRMGPTLGEELAKTFVEDYRKAQDSAPDFERILRSRQLLDEGIFTGTGAEARLALGRLANTLGVSVDETVTNTDEYRSNVGQSVAQSLKNFGAGTGLSDADREYAERMAGGQTTVDGNALKKILDISIKAQRGRFARLNKEREAYVKKYPELEASLLPLELPEPQATQDDDEGWQTTPSGGRWRAVP